LHSFPEAAFATQQAVPVEGCSERSAALLFNDLLEFLRSEISRIVVSHNVADLEILRACGPYGTVYSRKRRSGTDAPDLEQIASVDEQSFLLGLDCVRLVNRRCGQSSSNHTAS
jgi:hypothetical protein